MTTISPPTKQNQKILSFRYRIFRFITFNVLFAFIPVFISSGFRTFENAGEPLSKYVPDFLFFGIVICATVLGDIFDELFRGDAKETLLFSGVALIIGLIFAAVAYGGYQLDTIRAKQPTIFQEGLTPFALYLSIILCIGSIIIEIVLIKTQVKSAQGK
jgi:hypothetical protein